MCVSWRRSSADSVNEEAAFPVDCRPIWYLDITPGQFPLVPPFSLCYFQLYCSFSLSSQLFSEVNTLVGLHFMDRETECRGVK